MTLTRTSETVCGVDIVFSDYRILAYNFMAIMVVGFVAAMLIDFVVRLFTSTLFTKAFVYFNIVYKIETTIRLEFLSSCKYSLLVQNSSANVEGESELFEFIIHATSYLPKYFVNRAPHHLHLFRICPIYYTYGVWSNILPWMSFQEHPFSHILRHTQ